MPGYVSLAAAAILLLVTSASAGRPGYLLTLPKVIHVDIEEQVCVTFHNLDPYDVHLEMEFKDKKREDLLYTRLEVFQLGQGRCFNIVLPSSFTSEKATVLVRGTAINPDPSLPAPSTLPHIIYNETEVTVMKNSFLTFIQTDKPAYKPGQPVRFRILTVKPDLKPLQDIISEVWIEDPSGVRVMQWLGVQTEQGLGDFEMPLSKEPVLGTWKINAIIGQNTNSQNFKVEEYVLPKFEVTIKPPSYVLINAETIEAEICAKYTYGKPVKGTLKVNVCILQMYYGRLRPCASVKTKLNGCETIVVNASDTEMSSNHYSLYGAKVKFDATVQEEQTAIIQTTTTETPLERNIFKLEISEHSPDYNKPRLMYHGKVRAVKPDGTPAANELITLSATSYQTQQSFKRNFTTGPDGFFSFSLPPFHDDTAQFTINADAPEHMYSYRGMHDVYMPYTPRGYHTVKQWYSRSDSHLQIEPIAEPVACSSTLQVQVFYTTPVDTNYRFHYLVMSRGSIVGSGHKHHHFKRHDSQQAASTADVTLWESQWDTVPTPPVTTTKAPSNYVKSTHISSFTLDLPVTAQMSPLSHLTIFYVRDDGETVGDHRQFSVTPCVENQVQLVLGSGKESLMPGEKTNIRLQAKAGSLCSLAVVDKSVHLLAGNNQLSLAKVFELLKSHDMSDSSKYEQDVYCEKQTEGQHDDEDHPWDLPRPVPYRQKRMIMPWGGAYSDYYDTIQAFKRSNLAVLSDLVIESRPCKLQRFSYYIVDSVPVSPMLAMALPGPPGMAGPPANADLATDQSNTVSTEPQAQQLDLRDYFPETWLWDLHHIGSSGEVTLEKEVPHTITTWMASSFCSNSDTGLGVSPPASLKVFQPFFASFNLPYSVIRGEKVPVSVSVFNYLQECIVIGVALEKGDWFELTGPSRVSQLCICGGESKTQEFYIRPTKIGELNLTVKAESVNEASVCGNDLTVNVAYAGVRDAVTRQLIVEPEGKEVEVSQSSFVCPTGRTGVTEAIQLNLPTNGLVPDSARGFFTVIGDVMGPAMTDMDKLLKLPTGCGEQNMLKFAPNIFIMQYLTGTSQVNPEIKTKAMEFMTTGYQRELTYRHEDGSYSAFGKTDPEGSTWLTAFVTKSFAQAKPFIFIDEADLEASMLWFRSKQLENGCFPSVGRVLHKAMKGGLSDDDASPATLSAYVLIAMLETGVNREDEAVKDAVLCLKAQQVEDAYTVALMTYAMSLYDINAPFRAQLMDKLDRLAILKDGMTYWSQGGSQDSTESMPTYSKPAPADVEMTAYALLAKLSDQSMDVVGKAMPIVKWLTSQRNADGGFSSTQDTVVGLQALARYAALVFGESTDIDVNVQGQGLKEVIPVDADNRLVLHKYAVQVPNVLTVNTQGQGCVFIQGTVRYNVVNASRQLDDAFTLQVSPRRLLQGNDQCRHRNINVCAKYTGKDGASNMAVVSVKMVSGWIPEKDSLASLQKDRTLKLKRYEVDKNWVNFYFDELTGDYTCFLLGVEQDLEVQDAKAALVRVYDYYDTEKAAEVFYKLSTTCGTKEELPFLSEDQARDRANPGDSSQVEQTRLNIGLPDSVRQQLPALQCPVCPLEEPTDLPEIFCASRHAYKVNVRGASTFPLKALIDLRIAERPRLNMYMKYTLPENCNCPALQRPGRILILTKETEIVNLVRKKRSKNSRGSLRLAEDVTVVPLVDASNTERALRRYMRRNCAN